MRGGIGAKQRPIRNGAAKKMIFQGISAVEGIKV